VVSTTTMRSMAQFAVMAKAATAANDVARRPAMPAENPRRRQRTLCPQRLRAARMFGGLMQPVLDMTSSHCGAHQHGTVAAISELCKKSRKTGQLRVPAVCPTKTFEAHRRPRPNARGAIGAGVS
jgi:hypothetical protein